MQDNPNKTQDQERQERAQAILAIKFATIKAGSVQYWHALGLATQNNTNNTQNTGGQEDEKHSHNTRTQ